jgi:tetratricopeptide (TPR) repeat protein
MVRQRISSRSEKRLLVLVFFLIACTGTAQEQIQIHNIPGVEYIVIGMTNVDAGPTVGNILNHHYFPGIKYYARGLFSWALNEMNYFLARPQYTEMNQRQAEFMSTGHYLRGMIYLYHASGLGRLGLAQADFQSSIRWDDRNYFSYLELAQVLIELGEFKKAKSTLQILVAMNPTKEVAQQARDRLELIPPPEQTRK